MFSARERRLTPRAGAIVALGGRRVNEDAAFIEVDSVVATLVAAFVPALKE
jgi:hypothetical protein